MSRHLSLVPSEAMPGDEMLPLPGLPALAPERVAADHAEFDALIDAVPGRRESIAQIEHVVGQLEMLVAGLDPLQRAQAALTAYRDADGVLRSRFLELRLA